MLIKIVEAKYIGGHEIAITFNDGLYATVDLKNHLNGQMFKPLQDKRMFKSFTLNRWTIEWENGADFAPEFLHALALKENKTTHSTKV